MGCEVHDGFQILPFDTETELGFEISSKGEGEDESVVTGDKERCQGKGLHY